MVDRFFTYNRFHPSLTEATLTNPLAFNAKEGHQKFYSTCPSITRKYFSVLPWTNTLTCIVSAKMRKNKFYKIDTWPTKANARPTS